MSQFYKRYLQNLRNEEKRNMEETRGKVKMVADPTAMNQVNMNKVRRVQIMNKSDDFDPTANMSELQGYKKSSSTTKVLESALVGHYLFESLQGDDVKKIVDCMRPVTATDGEYIIREGEIGDLFYCLESGKCIATVDGVGQVMEYNEGGCFGELALLYNSPRAASVVAREKCQLWTLELSVFRTILAKTSSNRTMNRCEFLKKCAFLDSLSNDQITKLSGALDLSDYEDGEFIVRQGGAGTDFFIIEEGMVKCTQTKASGREVELITLQAGDYFGEMALLLNELRAANCIAVGKVKCLSLDREKFDMLLGPAQEVLSQRMRIRILQCVPLLSKLPEAKLTKLCGVMRAQSFEDGTYIIEQGDEGSRFYIINEGEVRCTRNKGSNGEEEELIRLGSQEFFGERALITNETRKANVIACGTVECLVLERQSFQDLLNEVQDDIVDTMSKRERDKEDKAKEEEVKLLEAAAEEVNAKPLTNFKIDELRIMRTIGTGSFGRVKMVQNALTGQVFALKYMNKAEVIANHQANNIMAERNLLFACSGSQFVLKLYQTFQNLSQIMMLMEFVQGGELWSYIYEKENVVKRNAHGGFEYPAVRFYIGNVILAFKHIHAKNIAYRDLKPENLLMDVAGYLKVIDFGFAKKFPFLKNGVVQDKTYTLCGTPEYLAPEIIMSKGYDKSVDYWALGCLLYELYLSRTPFSADFANKIFQNIIGSAKTLHFEKKMDKTFVELCKKLLAPNAAFRIGNLMGGVADIMEDPFFKGFDWEALEKRQMASPYSPPVKNALDADNFETYEEENNIPDYYGEQEPFQDF